VSYGTSLLPLQHHLGRAHEGKLFAVGSRCGRVVLFDADSLQQQELITLSPAAAAVASVSVSAVHGGSASVSNSQELVLPGKSSANALFKKAAGTNQITYSMPFCNF